VTPTDEYALLTVLGEADVPASLPITEQVRCLVQQVQRLQAELAERTTRRPLDTLLASLDERREDTLRLIADACLDEADKAEYYDRPVTTAQLRAEAKGWGWLAAHHKWPAREKHGRWFWECYTAADDTASHELSGQQPAKANAHDFPSPRAALEWVVHLIATGEWVPE
jgi:5-methylcytosine-specific restriction endonuclease McrA